MGNLHIRKSKHINNFVILDKEYQTITFLDEESGERRNLSPTAEAFFVRLISKKPGSLFHVNDFVKIYNLSPNTVCKYLDELQEAGLLQKKMIKNEKGQFYQHYFLQECPDEEDLKEDYEKEEYSSNIIVSSTRNGVSKQINKVPVIKNTANLKNCDWKPVSNINDGNQSQNLSVEPSLKICDPCINNIINNNNKNYNNNLNNKYALSSKEESALRDSESQSILTNSSFTLENNTYNNRINGDADQVGSKPKKIKNKAQLHEIEKEKNGGDVSVSEMIISKVSDLSYTDNQLANMQRQMNVISAEQKDAKTKQSKRERQFTLVKDYIDKNVTDPELNEKWKQYALTLKEKGSLASKTQFIEIYNNAQIITDKDKMLECLSNSISHGWVGVYSTDKKDNKKKETEVVQQYTVPTPMKDRKIARDENGNPLLF